MEWNVVVTIYQESFRRAVRALQQLGPTERSPYHNVLVMQVDDPIALLSAVEQRADESPALYDAISRVAPATRSFCFRSAEEFRENARSILLEWTPRLSGRSFHVRVHRRRASGDLRASDSERFFDDAILEATARAGAPARLSFGDPDAVIAIDVIDDRAGMALWSREELERHRLLRPD
jgi:tRNA(Ser,Leu) C12 N-acetylase TAN1